MKNLATVKLFYSSGLSEDEVKQHIANHMIDILNPHKVKEFRGDLVP